MAPSKQTALTAGEDRLFTIGYSGRTPAQLVAALKDAGIAQLLDVRSVPRSRKPGFSREALRAFVESKGIAYVHLPALGAPREILDRKKGGATFAEIAPAYRAHIGKQKSALREAASLARKRPSVLLCLEKEPSDCHRGILAERLSTSGFGIEHL